MTIIDNRARVESRRVPSMGTYYSLLQASVPMPSPEADMIVSHSMRGGQGWIDTIVTLTNRARHPQRFTYVYQDAAYMWFPDGDQRNTESVRIVASASGIQRYVNERSAGNIAPGYWQFVGTFNREHGVVAGILSFRAQDIAGIESSYVGVIPMDGTLHGQRGFRHSDIPRQANAGHVGTPGAFVNRFIALDFGMLASGESQTRTYTRIMTVLPPHQRSEDGIQAWVSSMVRRLQTFAASASPGQP